MAALFLVALTPLPETDRVPSVTGPQTMSKRGSCRIENHVKRPKIPAMAGRPFFRRDIHRAAKSVCAFPAFTFCGCYSLVNRKVVQSFKHSSVISSFPSLPRMTFPSRILMLCEAHGIRTPSASRRISDARIGLGYSSSFTTQRIRFS
jgi:hypothetical protein